MPKAKSLADLTDELGPKLQRAFLEAVYQLRGRVQIGLLIEMLEKRDIEGAVRAVGLDPVAFRSLDAGIGQAFETGGASATANIPAVKDAAGYLLKTGFNVRAPRAEAYLRDYSSTLIKEIADDQRTMIRQHLTAAMEAGKNPTAIAKDLVGSINKTTGRREGGVIGLTASQEEWVRSFEARLKSGDPGEMQKALGMSLRDKRYDRTIAKAIRDGKPLTSDQIGKMVTSYRNRALTYRAETIGRTEAMTALSEGQHQGWQQAIDAGQVEEQYLFKGWSSAMDGRVRHTHAALNGKRVKFNESFVSPSGARLRFPHDPNAPAAERVKCRCTAVYKLDYTEKYRRQNAAERAAVTMTGKDPDAEDLIANGFVPSPNMPIRDGHIGLADFRGYRDLPKAVYDYTGSKYIDMNNAARGVKMPAAKRKSAEKLNVDMVGAFKPTSTDYTLYRAVPVNASEYMTAKPGDTIRERGYSSTSRSSQNASHFAYGNGVMIKVRAPAGTPAIVTNANEAEVILPAGMSYRVISTHAVPADKVAGLNGASIIHEVEIVTTQ